MQLPATHPCTRFCTPHRPHPGLGPPTGPRSQRQVLGHGSGSAVWERRTNPEAWLREGTGRPLGGLAGGVCGEALGATGPADQRQQLLRPLGSWDLPASLRVPVSGAGPPCWPRVLTGSQGRAAAPGPWLRPTPGPTASFLGIQWLASVLAGPPSLSHRQGLNLND